MSHYSQTLDTLRGKPAKWLVTGAAGFIGSHLLEALLKLNQTVVGLDNFATGSQANLDDVKSKVPAEAWARFRFVKGSVCNPADCAAACAGVDFILHEAGFISVPQSIEDPATCNAVNVDGFLNMLIAARDAGVKRFVYASSSAVYGDDPTLPKVEAKIGMPLSPYGTSKFMDELYADVFRKNYPIEVAGLRYFNVFGPRQNPEGGYAAVIPKWVSALVTGEACHINGDGSITRDFCHIDNVVQANILAATTPNPRAEVYNVALGTKTTLLELYSLIAEKVARLVPSAAGRKPVHNPPRPGDIEHSMADIAKITKALGYQPVVTVDQGMDETVRWYAEAS